MYALKKFVFFFSSPPFFSSSAPLHPRQFSFRTVKPTMPPLIPPTLGVGFAIVLV